MIIVFSLVLFSHIVFRSECQLNSSLYILCPCLVVLDNSVQSVVSFDQGGEWVPLRKPANSKCDATAKDPDKVKRRNRCVWRKNKHRKLISPDGMN